MSKSFPPKEQTKQSTTRPASSSAAATKQGAGAASGDAARSDGKAPMPQVSRVKSTEPSRDQIEVRAYHIWIERGQPWGCEDEIWLEAEGQLRR